MAEDETIETPAADPNAELIAALEHEREGYLARGQDDRAKQVDAELKRLGASKRTAKTSGKDTA
jgi:hypothetical protein